jgi:hypothetical protein
MLRLWMKQCFITKLALGSQLKFCSDRCVSATICVQLIRKELLCNLEHGIYNMNLIHRRDAKGAKKTDKFMIYGLRLWIKYKIVNRKFCCSLKILCDLGALCVKLYS